MRLKIVQHGLLTRPWAPDKAKRSVQNSVSNRLFSVGNPLLGKYFALFASQINSPYLIFSLRYTCPAVDITEPLLERFCVFFSRL